MGQEEPWEQLVVTISAKVQSYEMMISSKLRQNAKTKYPTYLSFILWKIFYGLIRVVDVIF